MRWGLWLAVTGCVVSPGPGAVPDPADPTVDTDVKSLVPPLPWSDKPCEELRDRPSPFEDVLAHWDALDAQAPPPPGGLVVTGSSSIRRWEHVQRLLAAHAPVQRGFGGAWLHALATHADRLVLRHRPRGVLVFAGANDVAGAATAEETYAAWRCLVEQVHEAQPGTPMVWIPVTPTPLRWSGWAEADALNRMVAALAPQHPSLSVVDVVPTFLATGSPPDDALFVGDRLHLSEAGYDLWADAIVPAVAERVPADLPVTGGLAAGALVRVDLGPATAQDGLPAPAIDGFGIHWNAWQPAPGSAQVLAGERRDRLVDTLGRATPVGLVVSGGFRANGLQNGGLTDPDGALGTMAVPEATGDFFYTGGPDDPGGITISGLDPALDHTLRLFASRADAERRVSTYVVHGAGAWQTDLQTSGPGAGQGDRNRSVVAVLDGLRPDAWGRLHLDVQRAEGAYAYLSLLEIEAVPRP